MDDHITTLTQRRDYLSFRIEAKEKCGWDTSYDRRERDALTWVLNDVWQWLLDTKEDLAKCRLTANS